ncbi:ATP-NAD kinase [Linderina pennispora]|uniref:ATP-NAD kinase n=1 Tax=Linderina pennispora TaxID=61395 RepID=A0A1Y1WKF3_9FUNG|nr:ATP-NAD kinase [Linderina pennispora]ORX74060.1 ATP-NAD kinase [Linderina pennispora]
MQSAHELGRGSETPTVGLVETAVSVREVSKRIGRTVVQVGRVRRIMIVTKPNDTGLVSLTRDLALWLLEQGLSVFVEERLAQQRRFHLQRFARFAGLQYWTMELCAEHPEMFDFVVTLGGDGTVLYTSWLFQRTVPPIIPFHLGSLGFLTVFDHHHARRVLASAIHAGVRINLRMRFTCTVYRLADAADAEAANAYQGKAKRAWRRGESFQVLNELVVDRGPSPYLSQIELYGDGNHLTTVEADGLCLATPTGSTAYSLAAGGSLVHPEIPAIMVTPICPHTLSFRPMLLPDSMVVRVVLPPDSRNTAWASFDGRHRIELRRGDHIQITASKYPLPTTQDWMASLSRCLNWNERKRQKKFAGEKEEEEPDGDEGDNAGDEDEGDSDGRSDETE